MRLLISNCWRINKKKELCSHSKPKFSLDAIKCCKVMPMSSGLRICEFMLQLLKCVDHLVNFLNIQFLRRTIWFVLVEFSLLPILRHPSTVLQMHCCCSVTVQFPRSPLDSNTGIRRRRLRSVGDVDTRLRRCTANWDFPAGRKALSH